MAAGERAGREGAECEGADRELKAGGGESRTGRALWGGGGDPVWQDQRAGKGDRDLLGAAGCDKRDLADDEGRSGRGRYCGSRRQVDGYSDQQDAAKREGKIVEPGRRVA